MLGQPYEDTTMSCTITNEQTSEDNLIIVPPVIATTLDNAMSFTATTNEHGTSFEREKPRRKKTSFYFRRDEDKKERRARIKNEKVPLLLNEIVEKERAKARKKKHNERVKEDKRKKEEEDGDTDSISPAEIRKRERNREAVRQFRKRQQQLADIREEEIDNQNGDNVNNSQKDRLFLSRKKSVSGMLL